MSWKAFFFGSSDAANSITVDKPPASLWVMALSVLLMFRFNNPDALLVLLMLAAVWATLRGVEDGRTRWLVLTGAFVGLGFLTMQLQVMLVVPPLALTYLIAGPPKLGKRILQLFAALGALVVSAGWWLLTVELWPADSRPWIGGSQDNSILELTLGYNGFGRLSGNERGGVVPGGGGGPGGVPGADAMPGGLPGGGGGMWGSTGITRLFEPAQGGQIAWLLPTASILLIAGVVLCGRAPRTDPRLASFVVWGSWLAVTGLVFSFMAGIFHAYYTVALAPAVAALVEPVCAVASVSNTASGYQLATERPVMPIGGFNGSDPSPTVEQFQQYVEDGRIHYFIPGGMGGGRGGEGTASQIAEWVQANFASATVDGITIYDLTAER